MYVHTYSIHYSNITFQYFAFDRTFTAHVGQSSRRQTMNQLNSAFSADSVRAKPPLPLSLIIPSFLPSFRVVLWAQSLSIIFSSHFFLASDSCARLRFHHTTAVHTNPTTYRHSSISQEIKVQAYASVPVFTSYLGRDDLLTARKRAAGSSVVVELLPLCSDYCCLLFVSLQ